MNIQVFLDFANFYINFIKNVSKITKQLTLIFWTINKSASSKSQGTQTNDSKKNEDVPRDIFDRSIGKNIENLSFIIN